MLLDKTININYDCTNMATEDGAEASRPGPETTVPRIESELGAAARRTVAEAIRAKAPEQSTPPTRLDKAVVIHNGLQSEEPSFGVFEDTNISFPSPVVTYDGKDYTLKQNEVFLGSVHGRTETGDIICSFRDKDGNTVMAKEDVLVAALPAEGVTDAFNFAFKSELDGLLEGDEKKLFNAYTESLPQNANPTRPEPEVNTLITQVAEKYGMLKVADVRSFVDGLPEEQKTSADVVDLIAKLRGGVLVSSEDFRGVLEAAGQTKKGVDDQRSIAQTELSDLRSQLTALPADAEDAVRSDLEDKIHSAESRLTTLKHASEALAPQQPENEGTTLEKGPEIQIIDTAITERVSELQDKRTKLLELKQSNSDLTAEQAAELSQAEAILNLFDKATKLTGPIGVQARAAAINQALLHTKGEKVTSAGTLQLERVNRDQLPAAAEQARTDLAKAMEAAGIPEELRESAQDVLSTPEKLNEFLSGASENPAIQALLTNKDVNKALYGDNKTVDIDRFLSAAQASLSEEQQKKLVLAKKLAKGGLITAGGLGLLLLAITGVAMVFVGKGMSSDSRAA